MGFYIQYTKAILTLNYLYIYMRFIFAILLVLYSNLAFNQVVSDSINGSKVILLNQTSSPPKLKIGMERFSKFVQSKLNYNTCGFEKGDYEIIVYTECIVDSSAKLVGCKVVKTVGVGAVSQKQEISNFEYEELTNKQVVRCLEEQALKVVSSIEIEQPAYQGSIPVAVKYFFPISFYIIKKSVTNQYSQ